jgi:hypothetical protein
LPSNLGRDSGREHRIARARVHPAGGELRQDQRPRRIAIRAGEIQAAQARGPAGLHQRPYDADRLADVDREMGKSLPVQLCHLLRLLVADEDGQVGCRAMPQPPTADAGGYA